jgi:acyl-CoA-binding protein
MGIKNTARSQCRMGRSLVQSVTSRAIEPGDIDDLARRRSATRARAETPSGILLAMSDLAQRFAEAQARIRTATALSNEVLLDLYALYKQATAGDVSGGRPGMLDLRGRAKHDAWARRKGMTADAAMTAYIALVDRHVG